MTIVSRRYCPKEVQTVRRLADLSVMDVVRELVLTTSADGNHLFRAALDAAVDGHSMWEPVLGGDGRIADLTCAYTNEAGAQLTGRTVDQIVGSSLTRSAQAAGNPAYAKAMLDVVRTGLPLRIRSSLFKRSGGEVWVDLVAVRLPNGGLSCSARDVTAEVLLHDELHKTNAELARLASTDPLTNLMNRRAWTVALAGHLEHARRSRQRLVVALLDLDRFKLFNDTHGHLAGDDLLCEVAGRWRKALPAEATLARIGGEEFAVALPDMQPAAARALLERLCQMVPREQTSSAGLTVWDAVEGASSLVGRADAALYAAKHAGRNRVEALLPLP